MNVLLKGGEELEEVEAALSDLKAKRTDIMKQLSAARGSVVDISEPVEASIKKYLQSFYRPNGTPHAARPDPQALRIEAEALDASLERLRAIRTELLANEATEKTRSLMPAYLESIKKLQGSLSVAVACNEAVLAIEREIPTIQACSKAWNSLNPLSWARATPLKEWRELVTAYLNSQKS